MTRPALHDIEHIEFHAAIQIEYLNIQCALIMNVQKAT